jgi:four helix bundle protein
VGEKTHEADNRQASGYGRLQEAFEAAFVSKLNDSEAEAAESQTWLEFAVRCTYVSRDAASLYSRATMR